MLCPLRPVANAVGGAANTVGRFLLAGATNYATEFSIEKRRLARRPQAPHLEVTGTAAGQHASELHEPIASAVPQSANNFTFSDPSAVQFVIQIPTQSDTYSVGNASISYERSGSLIVPSWAVTNCFVIGCVLWFLAIGFFSAYRSEQATLRKQLAEAISRAEHAEKQALKEQTRNTRARKNLASVKDALSWKLACTEGAFHDVLTQYGVALDQLGTANDRMQNFKLTASVLQQEIVKANANATSLTEQLAKVHEQRETEAKVVKRDQDQLKARLAIVKYSNVSLCQRIKTIKEESKTKALKKERVLNKVKNDLRSLQTKLKRRTATSRKLHSRCLYLEDAHRSLAAWFVQARAENDEVHLKALEKQKKEASNVFGLAQAMSAELIEALESERQRLDFRNAILEQDQSELRSENEALRRASAQAKEESRADRRSSTTTIRGQKAIIAEAKKRCAELMDEIVALASINTLLSETVTVLAGQQRGFVSEIGGLKRESIALHQHIEKLEQQRESLRDTRKEAEEELRQVRDELDEVNTRLDNLRVEVSEVEHKNSGLIILLHDANHKIGLLETRHGDLVAAHDDSLLLQQEHEEHLSNCVAVHRRYAALKDDQDEEEFSEEEDLNEDDDFSDEKSVEVQSQAGTWGDDHSGPFEPADIVNNDDDDGNDNDDDEDDEDDDDEDEDDHGTDGSHRNPTAILSTSAAGPRNQKLDEDSLTTPTCNNPTFNATAVAFVPFGLATPAVQPAMAAPSPINGESQKRKDGPYRGKWKHFIDRGYWKTHDLDTKETVWCWHNERCQKHEGTNGVSCTGESPDARRQRIRAGQPRMNEHNLGGECHCW